MTSKSAAVRSSTRSTSLEKHRTIRASIDAADADAKSLPRPPNRFRWRATPGTRRLKGQFAGDWPSLRRRNHTDPPTLKLRSAGPSHAEASGAGLVLRSAQREAGWLADRSCAGDRQSSYALASFGGQPTLLRSVGWRMGCPPNSRSALFGSDQRNIEKSHISGLFCPRLFAAVRPWWSINDG
jgi:hypothetical protein